MYKLNLEIFCNNYNDSMIIQEKIMEIYSSSTVAVKRLNLEQIDNQEFRGIAQAPPRSETLRNLLEEMEEEEKEKPQDFLDEKDMEL